VAGDGVRPAATPRPFVLHFAGKAVEPQILDEDLDPRLVFVVPAAIAVIDPQDGFEVVEQLGSRQKFVEQLAAQRCSAQTATNVDGEARLAVLVQHGAGTDIVEMYRGTIFFTAADGNLELARQKQEFRRQR